MAPFERFVEKLDPRYKLLRAWPLSGGVSAEVTALLVRRYGGQIEKWVVHRYGAANCQGNPEVAADEFGLLQQLKAAGLEVPTPRYVSLFERTPVLVTEYLEGSTEAAPAGETAAVTLADFLHRLHSVRWAGWKPLKPQRSPQRSAVLDRTLSEGQIRGVLEPRWPPPLNEPAALHGDLWPGNVLWRAGQLVAVIDWEDAALGDPLSDVGNARLELLFSFGLKAMHAFTQRYRFLSNFDFGTLPYWDLRAALRPAGRMSSWGLDANVERVMRARHREFVSRACSRLPRG